MIKIYENWLCSASVDINVFVEITPKMQESKQLAQDVEKRKTKVIGPSERVKIKI